MTICISSPPRLTSHVATNDCRNCLASPADRFTLACAPGNLRQTIRDPINIHAAIIPKRHKRGVSRPPTPTVAIPPDAQTFSAKHASPSLATHRFPVEWSDADIDESGASGLTLFYWVASHLKSSFVLMTALPSAIPVFSTRPAAAWTTMIWTVIGLDPSPRSKLGHEQICHYAAYCVLAYHRDS